MRFVVLGCFFVHPRADFCRLHGSRGDARRWCAVDSGHGAGVRVFRNVHRTRVGNRRHGRRSTIAFL